MHWGAWMLLTRPMLLRAVKMTAIAANSAGPAALLPSPTLADGKVWYVGALKGASDAIYEAKC
jgi:hypothetical protein